MARRRFFVDSIRHAHAQVSGDQAHHLTRVLRVEPGQKYEISDNQSLYLAQVETARKDFVSFEILERLDTPAPPVHLAVFACLIKFDRFEWIIEKATELGAERVTPVESDRVEKGLAEAARKRGARWNRIAHEASEQARRARLPEIAAPVPLAEALRCTAAYRYVLEESGAPALLEALPEQRTADDQVALLAGPEGGWTERERAAAAEAGWRPVSLGSNILRAETAALSAVSIVVAAWFSTC